MEPSHATSLWERAHQGLTLAGQPGKREEFVREVAADRRLQVKLIEAHHAWFERDHESWIDEVVRYAIELCYEHGQLEQHGFYRRQVEDLEAKLKHHQLQFLREVVLLREKLRNSQWGIDYFGEHEAFVYEPLQFCKEEDKVLMEEIIQERVKLCLEKVLQPYGEKTDLSTIKVEKKEEPKKEKKQKALASTHVEKEEPPPREIRTREVVKEAPPDPRLGQLQDELEKAKLRERELKKKIAALEQQIEELKQRIKDLEQQIKDLEKELKEARNELRRLKEELDRLKNELERLKSQPPKSQQVEKTVEKVVTKEKIVEVEKIVTIEDTAKIEELQQIIRDLEEQIRKLKAELAKKGKEPPPPEKEVVKVQEEGKVVKEKSDGPDEAAHRRRVMEMEQEIRKLLAEIERLKKIIASLRNQIEEMEAAGMVRPGDPRAKKQEKNAGGFFIPQFGKHEISFSTRKVFERLYRDAFERWGRLQEMRTQWGQRSDAEVRRILESIWASNPCGAFAFDEPEKSPFAQTSPRGDTVTSAVGYIVETRDRGVKWTQSKGVSAPHFWEKDRVTQQSRLNPCPSLPSLSSTLQKKGVMSSSAKTLYTTTDPRTMGMETLRPQTSPAGTPAGTQDPFRLLFAQSAELHVDGAHLRDKTEPSPSDVQASPSPTDSPPEREPRDLKPKPSKERPPSRETPALGQLVRPKSRDGTAGAAAPGRPAADRSKMNWANWGEPTIRELPR